MIVGFTGSRKLTPSHRFARRLEALLAANVRDWLHHGSCIGADAAAHTLAARAGWSTHAHPGSIPALTAELHPEPTVLDFPKPNLNRNRDIVDACDILIVAPSGFREARRSGTWATYRYARRIERPRCILWPDGVIEYQPHPPDGWVPLLR